MMETAYLHAERRDQRDRPRPPWIAQTSLMSVTLRCCRSFKQKTRSKKLFFLFNSIDLLSTCRPRKEEETTNEANHYGRKTSACLLRARRHNPNRRRLVYNNRSAHWIFYSSILLYEQLLTKLAGKSLFLDFLPTRNLHDWQVNARAHTQKEAKGAETSSKLILKYCTACCCLDAVINSTC